MVSAMSPRSWCRRRQSPQTRALRPSGCGVGAGRAPGILASRRIPGSCVGTRVLLQCFPLLLPGGGRAEDRTVGRRPRDAGPRLWPKAPAGFGACGTSLQPADLKGLLSAGQCRLPGHSHSLPQDFPGPASLYGSTPLPPPCAPLALCLISESRVRCIGLAFEPY